MIGNGNKNKWCCFCAFWTDPAQTTIKPRPDKIFYDVDATAMRHCRKMGLNTKATFSCQKFERKL